MRNTPQGFSYLLLLCIVFCPEVSFSQSSEKIDQATKAAVSQAERMKQQGTTQPPSSPKITQQTPAKTPARAGKKFFIATISLEGNYLFTGEELKPLVKKYEHKEITIDDLNNLCREIEADYLRWNLVAAAFLPPQDITSQKAVIRIVEAKMGQIIAKDHRYFKKDRLAYYWQLIPDEYLDYTKIVRSVQQMNKNPDRQVKAALQAGKIPGTTDVVLTPETQLPLHATVSADNEGSPSTGTIRQNVSVRHNNFLSLDDTLLTGYSFGNQFNGKYIYHSLPVSPWGTSLLYGHSYSTSTPKKDLASYNIRSDARTSSISVHQDLYDDKDYLGEVFLGFDAKDKGTSMDSGTYTRDRLRVISAGASVTSRTATSTTTISPEISQGITNLGASKQNNPLASRSASSVFTKTGVSVQHRRKIGARNQLTVKNKIQLASTRLTPQETMSLGGADSVRGYPSGDFLADNANLLNVELAAPATFIPKKLSLPYAGSGIRDTTHVIGFMDYGYGRRRNDAATERNKANLVSAGFGIQTRLYNQANLSLSWGFPLGGNRSITETGRSRFHFAFDFQDTVIDELQRIEKRRSMRQKQIASRELLDDILALPHSAARKKLFSYYHGAEHARQRGKLQYALKLYDYSAKLLQQLRQQSYDYVLTEVNTKIEELSGYRRQALLNQKAGLLDNEKYYWQKIIREAEPQQLLLKF